MVFVSTQISYRQYNLGVFHLSIENKTYLNSFVTKNIIITKQNLNPELTLSNALKLQKKILVWYGNEKSRKIKATFYAMHLNFEQILVL